MPLAIIIVALGLIAAGIRGSYKDLFALLVGDFTGTGNFLNWLVAIALVGCLGYVPRLQPFSRAFIALILVAIFLKQGTGVMGEFVAAIQGASAGTAHPNPGADPNGGGGSSADATNPLMSMLPSGVQAAVKALGGGTTGTPGSGTPTGNPASPLLGAAPGSLQQSGPGNLLGADPNNIVPGL